MVVTFTGSIVAVEGDRAETRTVLAAAIACNLAWGIVDAAMYLIANFAERARAGTTLRAIREAVDRNVADRLIRDALPPAVANVLTPVEVDALRDRLNARDDRSMLVSLNRRDFIGAAAVFLLVFLSTFPIVIPFLLMSEIGSALRVSNAIALLMLFLAGWSLGRYAGRPGWRTGISMVAVGVVLVGITSALGG
jgi:VIT1/CCC1 family predicted Fe2+/Mn2+ transporter